MTASDAVHLFKRRKQLQKLTPSEIASLLVNSAKEHGENADGPESMILDLMDIIEIIYSSIPITGVKRGQVLCKLQERFHDCPEFSRIIDEPKEA